MYFLGIDTSTTSSKAWRIDEKGEGVAVVSNPHTLQTPKPLWSEQDPREWWDAVAASIKSVLEGAAFGLKDSFTLIQNAGLGQITQVRGSGGGTKGELWCQIMASVFNAELATVNTTESGA